MSTRSESPEPRRPWSAWPIAIVMLALYLGGARDHLLILLGDTGYLREQFGEGGVRYFTDYPLILRAVWTVNIVAGLLGPVLLLARSRWAAAVSATAAGAQILLLVVTLAVMDRWALLGPFTAWFDIGVAVLTAAFALYCASLRRRSSH